MSEKSPLEAAKRVSSLIKSFAAESPENRMPTSEREVIFDEPVVHYADADDPIFEEYKRIIGEEHQPPREALDEAYENTLLADRISVISWILPITEPTRRSNSVETRTPSRLWSHTRWFGEKFNEALRQHVVASLKAEGFLAVAPGVPPLIKMFNNEKGLYSNWSERHIAYAAGLGTFSLSDGFITERGIAHRCGSVVTSLDLPASNREASGPYANCLTYAGEKCGLCIERCPTGAISENGHDKIKCGGYLREIGYNPAMFKDGYDLETSVAGCGLCQAGVPCEAVNPTRR